MRLRYSEKPMLEWDRDDVPGLRYCAVIRADGRALFSAFAGELFEDAAGRSFIAAELWQLRSLCRDDPARREEAA